MAKVKSDNMSSDTKTKRVVKKTLNETTSSNKTTSSKPSSKTTSKSSSKTTSKPSSKTSSNFEAKVEAKVEAKATNSVLDSSDKNVVEKTDCPPGVSEKLNDSFNSFMVRLNELSTMMSSLKTEYRNLSKLSMREFKQAHKASSKRKRKNGTRAPSGFVKPTKISNELADFLGKEKGSEMARTQVTREINTYIRAHQLQDKSNGRKINADKKLSTLLRLTKTDELTYFNLQRYMSPHFAKSVPSVTKTVTSNVTSTATF